MLPEAFHDISKGKTGGQGLCHLQMGELQHLPARLHSRTVAKENERMTLRQNR